MSTRQRILGHPVGTEGNKLADRMAMLAVMRKETNDAAFSFALAFGGVF